MTPEEAAASIKETCDEISKLTLRLNPAIRAIDKTELRDELLQSVYKLTIDLEVVKKILRKKADEPQPDL